MDGTDIGAWLKWWFSTPCEHGRRWHIVRIWSEGDPYDGIRAGYLWLRCGGRWHRKWRDDA